MRWSASGAGSALVLLVGCASALSPSASAPPRLDQTVELIPTEARELAHLPTAVVVDVQDGDTLTVLDRGVTARIRLDQIDAPEKDQPFGPESKASLEGLCLLREAQLEVFGADRYGRTLARVICDGVDANAEQLRRGMAWVYWQYARDVELFDLQTDARRANAGLWAAPDHVPPWQWRRSR